jgi:hypothetical protein
MTARILVKNSWIGRTRAVAVPRDDPPQSFWAGLARRSAVPPRPPLLLSIFSTYSDLNL